MWPKEIGQAFIEALTIQFETLLQQSRRACDRLNEIGTRCSNYDREIDDLKSQISFMGGRVGEAKTRCADLTREIKKLEEDGLKSDGSFRGRDNKYVEVLDKYAEVFDAILDRVAALESDGAGPKLRVNELPSSAVLAYKAAIDEISKFLDERPSFGQHELRAKLAMMRAIA